jgi:hypothetical protein
METVLRDAMASDTLDPAGIYFGTRSGMVYGSNDDGKSWQVILEGVPPVVCVHAAVVGDGAPGATSARSRSGAKKSAKRKSAGMKTASKSTKKAKSRAR